MASIVSNICFIFLQWFCWGKHVTVCKSCPFSELFWSACSQIRTEYGEILHISQYSFRMQEFSDQNNSEYGHFLRSVTFGNCKRFPKNVIKNRYLIWQKSFSIQSSAFKSLFWACCGCFIIKRLQIWGLSKLT